VGAMTMAGRPAVASPFLEWGVAAAFHPGEATSGDLHVVCSLPAGTLLAVMDGLGHGPEAARAAELAAETVTRYCDQPTGEIVQRCHAA